MAERAKRILVVDDQLDNLELVARYLHDQGYVAQTAASGPEALALIERQPPDLVLLDVVMPDMDGFSVCRTLKTNPATMFIPVVLVTALDKKDSRIKGLQYGADEFLSKPVNKEELMARVRSLLRWREARDLVETQRTAELQKAFRRYLSPKVVDLILAEPGDGLSALNDRAARAGAVVLFADLRGFTRVAEQLPPIEVVQLLNEYYERVTDVVFSHDGTVFNMAGDCMLVGFGVPFEQENATDKALGCALEMQRAMAEQEQRWIKAHGSAVGLGIALNYGEIVVGNVGAPSFMTFTMIGHAVNVAGRLVRTAAAREILLTERVKSRISALPAGVTLERAESADLEETTVRQIMYRVRTTQGETT